MTPTRTAIDAAARALYEQLMLERYAAPVHQPPPEQRLNAVIAQRRRDLDLALHGAGREGATW